jgi:uncharacterized phage protein (TIGR01671 family)
MRIVKFRSWDKKRNEMMPVQQIDFSAWWVSCDPDCGVNPPLLYGDRNSFQNQPTDRHILMQFTGLLDKNGREIYEGDVVRDESGATAVYWSAAMGAWAVQDSDDCAFLLADCSESMEIIGNIYENPELLEVGR